MNIKRTKGVSIIELMLVISISGILIGIGVPELSQFSAEAKARSIRASIRQVLSFARQHSIDQTTETKVCGIDAGFVCEKRNITSIAAFVDTNKNNRIDEGEKILVINELNAAGHIDLRASFGSKSIMFARTGASKRAGSFIYCNPNYAQAASRVTISMAGRTYIGKDSDGDRIVEHTNGDPIFCS